MPIRTFQHRPQRLDDTPVVLAILLKPGEIVIERRSAG
jgi:hypothetical protein